MLSLTSIYTNREICPEGLNDRHTWVSKTPIQAGLYHSIPTTLDGERERARFVLLVGLARTANTSLLYLPQCDCDGDPNLSSPPSLKQHLQVLRLCQLLTYANPNPTMRFIAEEKLKLERASSSVQQW